VAACRNDDDEDDDDEEEEEEDEEDDDEDDTAELMRELEKIKRERADERERQARSDDGTLVSVQCDIAFTHAYLIYSSHPLGAAKVRAGKSAERNGNPARKSAACKGAWRLVCCEEKVQAALSYQIPTLLPGSFRGGLVSDDSKLACSFFFNFFLR
jgi:hypothetical protein